MYTITYRFEQVRYPVAKTVPCSICGKGKVRRSTTLTQTINPFNKHKTGPRAGEIKTRDEILRELAAEAREWTPVEASHPACRK